MVAATEEGQRVRTAECAKVPFPMEVSLVMPCLNEAETLEFCIVEAQGALSEAGLDSEVVIADNGSTDGSQQIARDLGARVVDVADKGYGNALRGGIAGARVEFIVMADADGSYDFSHAPRILAKLRGGYDLAMGNRFLGGIEPGAMPWKHQYIGNPVLSGIGRLFFACPAGDFHCGLRGFSKAAYDKMGLTTTGMEFASEMVIKSTLNGLKITEIPTVLRPDGRSRPPHLNSWRDGWRHLRFMLIFCPRWLFVIPGLTLSLVGIVLMMLLCQATWLWHRTGYGPLPPEVSVRQVIPAVILLSVGVQTVFGSFFLSVLGYLRK